MKETPFSILVLRNVILVSGFDTVVSMAETLPIALIPEQSVITTMWFYVVNIGRLDIASLLHTFHAQRMCIKVTLTGFVPCAAVASAACGACILRMK